MDWKQLIAQIQSQGLSQPQIAARCGCGQATISDLVNGKTEDPRDSLGQALRALHTEVMRAKADGKHSKRKNPDRDNGHKEGR